MQIAKPEFTDEILESLKRQPGIHDATMFQPALSYLNELGLIRPTENQFGTTVWHFVER